MRCFVTGGSGFIGIRLVQRLIADGHEVICLSRSGETSAMLHDLGAEVLSGDLTNHESIRGALLEAEPTHVAHLAAEIATQRKKQRIHQVNVEGTRAIVEACVGLGIEKFVFLSTVVRGMASGETFTEDTPIPATTDYGKSKEMGDSLVLGAHEGKGLPAVVLRPSHVYGPGGWFKDLLTDRLFRIPGDGENLWDVVHVDDVVSACIVVLDKAPPGEVYHVCDDHPVTMKKFFEQAAQALGRKPFGHMPVFAAKIAKGAGPVTAAVRGARSTNAKLRGLGWEPQYPNSADAMPGVIAEITGNQSAPEAAEEPGAEEGDSREAT